MSKPLKVALLGAGVVGSQVARIILNEGPTLEARIGRRLELVGIGVRRLEAERLILGYHARLDIERIRPTVTVYGEVTLKSHRPADLLHFEAVLSEIPEVVEAAQVSGPFDYLIKVVCPDVRAWGELADRLLQEGLGVDKIASHILMKDAKPFTGAPVTAGQR